MFFLPIIGPLLQAILGPVTAILGKFWDTKLAEYQTDANVATTAITASTQTLAVFKDDPGVRLTRDLFLFTTGIWYSMIVWDSIIAKTHPSWMFHPVVLPDSVTYVPHMVLIFLFGVQITNRFFK